MEIVLMNDSAIIPTRVSKESAGLYLYSSIDVDIEVGSINKDYTGEIIVIMTSLIEPIKIKKGQKIAELIISNIMYPEINKRICISLPENSYGSIRDKSSLASKGLLTLGGSY